MTRVYCDPAPPAQHLHGPGNYTAWHAWAADMQRTHKQYTCPDCRLPVIWRPIDADVDVEQLDLFGSEALP